jgi:predicted RNA binding protein YcfA (HicA-like mRNA interferase family)
MPLSAAECEALKQVLNGKATNQKHLDVARWLRRGDFEEPKGTGGSHSVWVHPSSGRRVLVADHGGGQMNPVFVKKVYRTIREANGCPE